MEKTKRALEGGHAAECFSRFLVAQGAVADPMEKPDCLPNAKYQIEVKAQEDGYIQALDALTCGNVCLRLGAGRMTKTDHIDPAAGIVLCRKIGDFVRCGDTLAVIHTSREADPAWLLSAYTFSDSPAAKRKLIYKSSF